MLRNIASFEIIYFYTLLKNYLASPSKETVEKVLAVFRQRDFFNKNLFIKISLFIQEINFQVCARKILSNIENPDNLYRDLSKFEEIVGIFIQKYSEPLEAKEICLKKLEKLINYLSRGENQLFEYLSSLAEFLYKHIQKNNLDIVSNNLYNYLLEIYDMFEKAEKIVFNSEKIEKCFKPYFNILNLNPQNAVFLNNEKNIKILQDILPNELLSKCFYALGLKEQLIRNNEFFVLEMNTDYYEDKKYQPLLSHELGHLLDVNIFEFNMSLINEIYSRNNNINVVVMQRWLNEIIADNIAFNIEGETYNKLLLKEFNDFENNFIYPPVWLRMHINNSEHPIKKYNEYPHEIKTVITELINNKELIRQVLSIVKN